jgi:hypothetical protein
MQAAMSTPIAQTNSSIKLKLTGVASFGLLPPPSYYGGSAMVVVFHRSKKQQKILIST